MLDFLFRGHRALKRIDRAANARIVERMRQREAQSVPELIDRIGVPLASGVDLLTEIAAMFDIDPATLRADDLLGDVCRITAAELPDIPMEAWAESGLPNHVLIGCYDIMYIAESRTTRTAWRSYWEGLDPRPHNEEAWIDIFMAMRLDEFLRFVHGVRTAAPAVSARSN